MIVCFSEKGFSTMRIPRLLARSLVPGAILAMAVLPLCGGCGPGGYSGPTGTVSGTVTLNGEPVPAGCGVAFISDEGHTASGTVAAGGSYQLSAGGEGNEVPAANYRVCITPPAQADASGADYDKMMEAESAEGAPEEATEAAVEVIPAKYQTTTTSELSFQVKAGSNTIDIPLE